MLIFHTTEYSKKFIQNLANDLSYIGCESDITQLSTNGDYVFRWGPCSVNQVEIYRRIKQREKFKTDQFVNEMQKQGILDLFGEGAQIQIKSIHPSIQICRSTEDFNIARYCMLLQGFPNSFGVGRRISGLVYDVGQKKRTLLGLICLSDPSILIKDRDSFLKWSNNGLRKEKLKYLSQLSVCMALPPYNLLFGGKLTAALAFSDQIQNEFSSKYRLPLLAIQTTCASGLHAAVFNRINLSKIEIGSSTPYSSNLYRRIGKTTKRTLSIISDDTLLAAKQLLHENELKGLSCLTEGTSFRTQSSKNRVIYKALSLCHLPRSILDTYEKGLYIGWLNDTNLGILRDPLSTEKETQTTLSVDSVADYWMTTWVMKAIKDNERFEKFKRFSTTSIN